MRCPFATWRGPIPNMTPGGMGSPVMGLALHIEQGTESGTDNWFHNPAAQASAHFGNPKSGPLDQWVDTADEAWAQMAGNRLWISVEHEGMSGGLLTNSQIVNDAHLLAWLHETDGVPFQLTDDPNTPGLGWHGMGGAAWGGHLDCPGAPIVGQRQAILTLARNFVTPAPAPTPPPLPTPVGDDMQAVSLTLPGPLDGSGNGWYSMATLGVAGLTDVNQIVSVIWIDEDPAKVGRYDHLPSGWAITADQQLVVTGGSPGGRYGCRIFFT